VFGIVIVVAVLGGLWAFFVARRKRAAELRDAWEGVVYAKPSVPPDDRSAYRYVTITFDGGRREFVRVRREFWETLEPGDVVVKRPGELNPAKKETR